MPEIGPLSPERRYNQAIPMQHWPTVKFLARVSLVVLLFLPGTLLFSQAHAGAHTVLILPFENVSKATGLEWIGEAFPEVLGDRIGAHSMYVITRDERAYMFERFGIPQTLRPTRATLYRMAEQVDADYVILGTYDFDGNTFTAKAEALDMKALKLAKPLESKGPLASLFDIQSSLAWELLNGMHLKSLPPKERFLQSTETVRLDAFENYIRGILAGTRSEKINKLRQAVKLAPNYTMAQLQLGRAYVDAHDYDAAMNTLSRIPRTSPQANQANFLLGLAAYQKGDLEKAEAAFTFLAGRIPLPEIYNNLGVVAGKRGRRRAVEYYQKAVAADPNDVDYRLNLAIALYRNGDQAGATRQLREALQHKADDNDARNLQEAIADGSTAVRLPSERMKRTYDEAVYQQAALEITNIVEQRLATADPETHAAYYVERGREMLSHGFTTEAEKQFREALRYEPSNAAAHAGLAMAMENSDPAGSEKEAREALRLEPIADAYVVLARLGLSRKDMKAASENATAALLLDPANSAARAVQQSIESSKTDVVPEP